MQVDMKHLPLPSFVVERQVNLLKEQLSRIPALNNSRLKVKVATVDGFQGSECDIIILSCVRSYSRSNRGKTNHDSRPFCMFQRQA